MKKLASIFTFVISTLLAACAFVPAVQAVSMSDYLENKLTDHVFRGTPYTAPATIFIALFTTACTDAAPGTEVTGGSYARGSLATGLTTWAGTQSAGSTIASTGTGGTTSNNSAIVFVTPTAGWGTVTHIGMMDALTVGNMLICTALTVSKTINIGDAVSFPAASLTNQIDN